ncbi:hypothetical protein N7486_011339 [Penicillium sp. IBT 16267x]|nr:hypothetical protein N7486_011339 [Penicillium sp. IBT 16267x]
MRFSLAVSALALAVSVGAIAVTEPKEGADIAASSSLDVKWTYVNTDETSLDIYLVNNAVYPPVNEKLASTVSTSDGSYTVNVGNIAAGHGYQISLKSDALHNTGILAQSNQFNVTVSASQSTSSSSTETMTTTATSTSAVSTTTSTDSATTKTGTAAAITSSMSSGMMTSASSTANSTAAATATPSTGAGFAIAAHPVAALGVIGGALAFML